MSFLLKSAMGLGAVYFAMFSPALKPSAIGPTAAICASAAQAGLDGDASLRGAAAAAGCALQLRAEAQRLAAPAIAPVPAPAVKSVAGSLSEDDLREPWFGPGPLQQKAARRG